VAADSKVSMIVNVWWSGDYNDCNECDDMRVGDFFMLGAVGNGWAGLNMLITANYC